nr:MAG TPA: hypothetical protein [Caudoviricetes sp.]
MTIEITDEMIQSAVREQVKAKLSKIDIKSMVKMEVFKAVRERWEELRADNLVKEIKTKEVADRIVEDLTDRITHALEDDF